MQVLIGHPIEHILRPDCSCCTLQLWQSDGHLPECMVSPFQVQINFNWCSSSQSPSILVSEASIGYYCVVHMNNCIIQTYNGCMFYFGLRWKIFHPKCLSTARSHQRPFRWSQSPNWWPVRWGNFRKKVVQRGIMWLKRWAISYATYFCWYFWWTWFATGFVV